MLGPVLGSQLGQRGWKSAQGKALGLLVTVVNMSPGVPRWASGPGQDCHPVLGTAEATP